ncbi:anti-phage protein KwaA [Neobacillus sp. PS2-9]|uniref:anti-phage protein KwaA n=1 Tax=Neobacillus sp. PS2-9 TaxID=3070676 RepID=UPI0027E1C6BC|nr:anti-phage protein KwaA [Neobacillus sp. PS2-9]WML57447.1 anti-phage protein KwaA [Neobacillus sp. PS2-9]
MIILLKNNWDKIELYIISLWLLFLLILIVTIKIPICFGDNCSFIGIKKIIALNWVPILALCFLIFGIICVFRFKYKISGSEQTPITINNIENKNYEHLTFLSTYIIPLIAFDLTKPRYLVVLLVLLLAIGIIYLKTNLFYSNPTLAILGYRIYKADAKFRIENRSNIILISREDLEVNQRVSYRKIDENIYYVRVIR